MKSIARAAIALALGAAVSTFAPAPLLTAPTFDPSRLAASLCTARNTGLSLARDLLIAQAAAAPASNAASIPLFPDLTKSTFPVTTQNDKARLYFRQGLMFTYGFNHAGAVRSFREAQRLDPSCALCWWGEAVALGPNINAPMDDRDHRAAVDALGRAMALRTVVSPLERALVEALSKRYDADAKTDRATLDAAYADAMIAVSREFPNDDDVAVLATEAAMDTSPWNYWAADKKTPIGRAGEAIKLVESVLARNPAHPQAAHLYVHLMEASDPARAEAAADRLQRMRLPTAGHLVQMPSHIYFARGRWADSMRVNIEAARSDEAIIRATDDRSLLRYGYYPHNVHFIVTSAQMAGDMRTALEEARRLRTIVDLETSASIGWIQAIDAAPYLAMAQFAAPADILAMPAPDPRLPYAAGMWRFARATAYAGLHDWKGFQNEIDAIETLKTSAAFKGLIDQGVPAIDLMNLAQAAARGRFALAQGLYPEAIAHFTEAARIEASIPYQEPPYWYYPVRQSLGAALFLAGRPADASQAFREALLQAPNNGWALYGLAESEAAQGNAADAAAARAAFNRAWMGDRRWLRMERL